MLPSIEHCARKSSAGYGRQLHYALRRAVKLDLEYFLLFCGSRTSKRIVWVACRFLRPLRL